MKHKYHHTDQESGHEHKKLKKHHKNHQMDLTQFNNQVVKVFGSFLTPNYKSPWKAPKPYDGHGSASVIDKEKGLLLTCAHVGHPHTSAIWVRLGSDTTKYRAKVLIAEHDCDLALLQVDHPDFKQKAQQVELGDFQSVGKPISVVGYPFIGEEITVTHGKVSSNEIRAYMQGDSFCLASCVDAPINPGNSGGPVYNEAGKQIGVAFQVIRPEDAEGAGYIIPMPVIRQFLTNAYAALAKGIPSTGIPALPIKAQNTANPVLRQQYGMVDERHSGLLITRTDPLAKDDGLQVDDILMEIDGHKINNDATISSCPEICARLDYTYLISTKQIGESVSMKIMRNKKELTINFPLKYRTNELKVAGRKEYTMHPTFYIKNGIAFQPLTLNYMSSKKGISMMFMRDTNQENMNEIPQKTLNHQIVVINRVFNSDVTNGYTDVGDTDIVESINGIKIMHIHDVVNALETNTKDHHTIVLTNKSKIVMGIASPEEELDIIDNNQIPKTHSDDLTAVIQAAKNLRNMMAAQTQPSGSSSNNIFVPNFDSLSGSTSVQNPLYLPTKSKSTL